MLRPCLNRLMRISRLDPSALDVVRPAWLGLCTQLATMDADLGPQRSEAQRWSRRRAHYERWLQSEPSAIFCAWDEDGLLGYAMVHAEPAWSARLTGDPVVELETLSVGTHARGRGVGTALWEAAEAHLAEHGVRDATVGVLTASREARRFYAREGFRPFVSTWWLRPIGLPPQGADAEIAPVDHPPQRADVAITPVAGADLDELFDLYTALGDRHEAVGPDYLPTRRAAAEAWALERGDHTADGAIVLRAGDVGYVLATLSEEGYDAWDTSPVGTIEALVVREGGRGGGTGAALLAAAVRALGERGADAVELLVLEGNDAAQRFYARHGFVRVFEALYKAL